MNIFENKNIFISGGSGSLGNAFIDYLIPLEPKKIIIYSRGEKLQYDLLIKHKQIQEEKDILRFFIGDVRDKERLSLAMQDVDYCISAAALKQIDTAEYNPREVIKTNIIGTENIIECAIKNNVKKTLLVSTDKACIPVSLYGYTKAIAERLFQQANIYSKGHEFKTMIVRYGNVAGSRGSVIPYFKDLISKGEKVLPLTHEEITRYWITLNEACKMIHFALEHGWAGEIFVSKSKSFRVKDLITAMGCDYKIIGLRGVEKIHEQMISQYETAFDLGKYYVLPSNIEKFKKSPYKEFKSMPNGFEYYSNEDFMSVEEIKKKLIDIKE